MENAYAVLAGTILSLLFAFVPGLKDWYAKQESGTKQLIMLVLLFVAVAGRFGLSCLGKDNAFVCDANGAYDALVAFVYAAIASAGVYKATNYIGKPSSGAVG